MNGLTYLLQSNLYLILFFGLYWVVLRKETFNNYNRAYLVISALLSFVIPLWNFESVQAWFLTTKTTEVLQAVSLPEFVYSKPAVDQGYAISDYLSIFYKIGCTILALKLAANIFNLYRFINNNESINRAFSFFNNIIINNGTDPDDVIYDHERVHARQYHSFDVLVFEIIGIFCWFNPIIYAYKIAIKNIHEFIADDIASQSMASKIDYAMLLFSERFQTHPSVLVNNFFTKTSLKLRIQMLNKNKSKKMAVLKYGLIAPLFLGMLVFASATINAEKLSALIANANFTENQIVVSGKILNNDNKPLVGTNIIIKGKNRGTTADLDGNFIIKLDSENETLVVSHIGYYSKIVKANVFQKMNIVLENQVDEMLGAVVTAYSQTLKEDVLKEFHKKDTIINNNEIFTVVEQNAEYPGGQAEMGKFLAKNLRYPIEAQKNEQQGKVFLKFVVDKEGEISNIKVIKSAGSGLDEEAVRVVGKMPVWKPAKQNGQAVNSEFTMPVEFILEEDIVDTQNRIRMNKLLANPTEDMLFVLDDNFFSLKEFSELTKKMDGYQSLSIMLEEAAVKKYGEKGKNGAITIVSHKKEDKTGTQEKIYAVVEQNASFPGGQREMNKFLSKNLKYPEKAQRAYVKGRVFLSFIVKSTGEIDDIQVVKGLGFGLDEEAIRIVKAMPKWVPGMQDGKKVNSKFNLPISFLLE
jgi:TonB family protein